MKTPKYDHCMICDKPAPEAPAWNVQDVGRPKLTVHRAHPDCLNQALQATWAKDQAAAT